MSTNSPTHLTTAQPSHRPRSVDLRSPSRPSGPHLLWRLLPAAFLLALLVGFVLVSPPGGWPGVSSGGNPVSIHTISLGIGITAGLLTAWLGGTLLQAGVGIRLAQRTERRRWSGPGRRRNTVALLSAGASSQDVSRRLVEAQEAFHREMADYLHGHVQSKLVALALSISLCQKTLRSDTNAASFMLERIQEDLKRIQDDDLRRVGRELYPAIIKIGLAPAIQSLVDRFKGLIDIELVIGPEVAALDQPNSTGLPENLRLGIYRVAEEAITNVLKHAQASRVRVSLVREGADHLRVSVTDNGRGFDPERVSADQGLLGVADYAQAIGGRAQVSSAPDQGATVSLVLPVSWPKTPEPATPHPAL